jgi:glutamine---fructose-6-phosphate transaminase (isomerizing)
MLCSISKGNRMCGVAGVLGRSSGALGHVLTALRRLEYRGYDSAGVAVFTEGGIRVARCEGMLEALERSIPPSMHETTCAFGHTRWATHGPATESNAHPHRVGRVVLVHNGIIENHDALVAGVDGWVAQSDTDSERVAAAVDAAYAVCRDPLVALMRVARALEGMYALVVGFDDVPGKLFVARHGSPLVVGSGPYGMFVASDPLALAGLAERVVYMVDGDCGVVSADAVAFNSLSAGAVERAWVRLDMEDSVVEKAGHRHFMAKEIAEQPKVLAEALARHQALGAGLWGPVDPNSVQRLEAIACGTARLSAEVSRFWFEDWAGLPMGVEVASEAKHRPLLGDPARTVTVAVSQSGETADTLSALRAALDSGRHGLAVINSAGSSMERMASWSVPIHTGPEIGVASTKAFTGQLVALCALALTAARARGMPLDLSESLWNDLMKVPGWMSVALQSAQDPIDSIAGAIVSSPSALFLGRGAMAVLAQEAALKLKEITYIHAEAYPAGELKHGPIALIDDKMPVFVFAPSGSTFTKTLSAIQEVRARRGRVFLFADSHGIERARGLYEEAVVMPAVPEAFAPFVYAIPAQLLAYRTALVKGTDADRPRNLAKSVTVE